MDFGLSRCLRCTNSKYLDPGKSTCEDRCPDGFYPEGTGGSRGHDDGLLVRRSLESELYTMRL